MAKKEKPKVGLKIPTDKELRKRYPNMFSPSERDDEAHPKIPSRFIASNYQTGGGAPYGKVIEIYGEESSGKTLAALDFAYVTQQLGGVVLLADAEQSFTNDWALKNGLDLSKIFIIRDTAVETISDWVADMSIFWRSKLVKNEPILFICDSMAALDCFENINSKMVDAKADMGNRAKAIYKMFRVRSELLYRLGITQIYINQLRKNLKAGMFEDPDTTPGGNAMKFYAAIRIGMYGGKGITQKVKGKEIKVGRVTSIRIKKNKVAPPRNTIKGAPLYNNPDFVEIGFDKYHGLPDLLVEIGVVKKSKGGVYTMKDKTIARGEEKFKELIEQDEELRKKLIKKSGINTISKTRNLLDSLQTNLYPVDADISYKSQVKEFEEGEDDE